VAGDGPICLILTSSGAQNFMIRLETITASTLVALWLATTGCSSLPTRMPSFPSWTASAAAAEPGTRDWWKKNKRNAVLDPGHGWMVEGVPGYFDEYGRPMDAPMAEESLVISDDDKQNQGLLPGIDPKRNYQKAKAAVGLGPNEERAQVAYQKGQELFADGSYGRAAKRFAEAAESWPSSSIEQQALYQEANCYFFGDQYVDARDTYAELLEKYPNSGQVDSVIERLWSIGQYWEKHHDHEPHWALTPNLTDETRPWFDTLGHAIKAYEHIQLYDPTGPRSDDAVMAIAGIYFRTDRYNDADHYYALLRQQYPRSDFQFEAHLLGLRTKLQKYQGPKYDGTPLEEAKLLANQLRSQFSGRLNNEERERLDETRAQVAQAIASRDMTMAAHYENTQNHGSARVYYNEIIRKHPQTELAAEARERLAKSAELPARPEEPMKWLVELFPENPERTRVARVPELRDSRTGESETRLAEEEKTTVGR
jgi:outer membrane protein assembly factor BamD (BamD/ComL family)